MFKYDNRVKIPAGSELKIDDYFENLEKFNNNYRYRPNYENLIEFKSNKKEFLKILIDENRDQNLEFLKKISNKESGEDSEHDSKDNTGDNYNKSKSNIMKKPSNINKVLIFPSFQFFNINQFDDQEILKNLISKDYFTKIRLSSGYLNLSDFIINTFKSKDYEVEIVTSSPKANSFYKAGFIKKNIPYFYRIYEQSLLQAMRNKTNFSLFEFHRENWSFHSKGLWFYEKEKLTPSMTVIGSSNYNSRSYQRDVESQFYIYSFCENFSKKLQIEAEDNFSDCSKVTLLDIKKDKDIKLKLKHRLMARYLRKYL